MLVTRLMKDWLLGCRGRFCNRVSGWDRCQDSSSKSKIEVGFHREMIELRRVAKYN